MVYRDFLTQFVGQKGWLGVGGGHIHFWVGQTSYEISTLVEVGEDYVVFDKGDGAKTAYSLSMVSIQYK